MYMRHARVPRLKGVVGKKGEKELWRTIPRAPEAVVSKSRQGNKHISLPSRPASG